MTAPWMLDELAHAGAEHLDPAFVAAYDRKAGFADGPDDALIEDLGAFTGQGLDAGATVLDLGCGTGRFALAAAARFGRVVAVDVSPAMLAVVRRRAAAAHLHTLTCVQAGFVSYEHGGAPADGIHTRHALHQLPDFWKGIALQRCAQLLRPGGVLRVRDLIYDFRPWEAEEVFAGWFAGAATDPRAGYTGDDYAEHIRGEHSTFRWLFEPLLDAAGFDIVSAEYRDRLYGAYTCVRR